MREKLKEILNSNAIDIESDVDYAVDILIANGVTILPEGAIILTRAEIDALNKYAEARKNEAD